MAPVSKTRRTGTAVHVPPPQGPFPQYRALARAVILQAVKDSASRVPSLDGVVAYRDHGRRSHVAETARPFLSTPSPALTFWCLWLNIHPQTIIDGARTMQLVETDRETIH